MLNIIQIVMPIAVIILLCVLIYNVNILQLHLYDHHRALWEEVTFKKLFFIKRENLQILPVNHRIFKVLFLKTELNDKTLDILKLRIKVLFACVIVAMILVFLAL